MHISYSVADNCQNLYDSYGEICVHCNCCGRFDPKTKLQCQLDLNKRMLEEKREIDQLAEVERKDKRIQELELALSHKTVENTKLSGLSGFNATDLYR